MDFDNIEIAGKVAIQMGTYQEVACVCMDGLGNWAYWACPFPYIALESRAASPLVHKFQNFGY